MTGAFKFTGGGPWEVAETDDNEGHPETVIRGMDGRAGIAVAIDFASAPGMREANANLIAAAPQLLESVIAFMDAVRYAQDQKAMMSAIKAADDLGRAAIAKVHGLRARSTGERE